MLFSRYHYTIVFFSLLLKKGSLSSFHFFFFFFSAFTPPASLKANGLGELLAKLLAAGRVLAGDKLAAVLDDYLLAPGLGGLGVGRALLLELVLEHKGHELRELDLVLLGVAEACFVRVENDQHNVL